MVVLKRPIRVRIKIIIPKEQTKCIEKQNKNQSMFALRETPRSLFQTSKNGEGAINISYPYSYISRMNTTHCTKQRR